MLRKYVWVKTYESPTKTYALFFLIVKELQLGSFLTEALVLSAVLLCKCIKYMQHIFQLLFDIIIINIK